MNMKNLIAGIMGALLLLTLPALADYSGDHPLVPVEIGKLNGDVLFLVEDNTSTNYQLIESPTNNWTQTFTVEIPDGAKIRTARLYNYYNWAQHTAVPGVARPNVPGAPAEADITFSSDTSAMSVHLINPLSCDVTTPCDNPIVYNQDVVHYWDSKGPQYVSPTHLWNFAFGTIAMDVTSNVTGSGTYTAKIEHAAGGNTMNFVTMGFALLIVYEDETASPIKYWITEGADILWGNHDIWQIPPLTPEQATTEVLSARGIGTKTAELQVLAAFIDRPGKTPVILVENGKEIKEIGPFPIGGIKHLSLFDQVITLNNAGATVVYDRDFGDFHTVHNAILVDRLGKDNLVRNHPWVPSEESDEPATEPCATGEADTC